MNQKNKGKDGSKFDLRDSELNSMGELYTNIHQSYLITLNTGDFDHLIGWLNRMRVFQSYLKGYVGEDKQDYADNTRDKILEADEKITDELENKKQIPEKDSPSIALIEDMEEIKEDLEVLRDAAGFKLPMNQKVDPDTAMGDQL